ncbi:MAG: hypothetical protein HYX96_06205 [Chloroflexi bacterium]|nr:hypothetical protein [Chloroflexota bacterium]
MTNGNDKCPRCGGRMYLEYGHPICLNCGEDPQAPAARKNLYEKHGAEILADAGALGNKAAARRWGIPRRSLGQLVKNKEPRVPVVQAAAPAARPAISQPPLPPWSDQWTPEVQVQWLLTYEEVVK